MIIVNKSEIGAGTRGASLGFEAMRFESLKHKPINNFYKLKNLNSSLFRDKIKVYQNALNIDLIYGLYKLNFDKCSEIMTKSDNHIIISGDHSSSPFYLAVLKKLNPNSKIGVVWIDAHADLHSPYTSPSGNMHGMPLCISLGEDNLECKQNDLDPDEIAYWNRLKDLVEGENEIEYENLIYLGLRDYEDEEEYLIKRNNIFNLDLDEIRKIGLENVVEKVLEKLKDCDRIYVSFDVDSMDPDDVSRGTGTPVEDGFTLSEALKLNDLLTRSGKNTSFEIVEINPLLDEKNEMARNSLQIFYKVAENLKIDYE